MNEAVTMQEGAGTHTEQGMVSATSYSGSLCSYSTTMHSFPNPFFIGTTPLFDVSTMAKGAVADRA